MIIFAICKIVYYYKIKNYQKLIDNIENMGPFFVKCAQFISCRYDLFDDDFLYYLQKLCAYDEVSQEKNIFYGDEVYKIIEKEFQINSYCELYRSIDLKPASVGSLAQVHKAVTHDNKEVAIKILRPNAKNNFISNLKKIKIIIYFLKITTPKRYKYQEIFDSMYISMEMELDLRLEAANTSELREKMHNKIKFLIIPTVDWLKTTENILTTEWISCKKIDSLTGGLSSHNLLYIFFYQVLIDGFFHADLHSGNLMHDNNGKIVMVDFGIVGRLSEITRLTIINILDAFIKKDYTIIANIYLDTGYITQKQYNFFLISCRAIGESLMNRNLQDLSIANLLTQLLKLTKTLKIPVQVEFLLFQKNLLFIESHCRKIGHSINPWNIISNIIYKKHCNHRLHKVYYHYLIYSKKIKIIEFGVIEFMKLKSSKAHNKSFIDLLILIVLSMLLLFNYIK
ncbi:MAG: AarF/UbiB family protein [Anaplasmataceae bacterium]|nr:AarF/UbiB family protein [Anaplasmataceae bacterium]